MKHKFKQGELLIEVLTDKRTSPLVTKVSASCGALHYRDSFYTSNVLHHKTIVAKQITQGLKTAGFKVYEA